MATVDYRKWDWLPGAATEVEQYLRRLLTEAAVTAHDVSARAKSIASFQDKCDRKRYAEPLREVTDTVAVRIITYSVTDRERAEMLIRDRFEVKEDHNPGNAKPPERRGYDCQHLVITGENSKTDPGWMIAGGKLFQYFTTFGGLEIQIRTVAAHAWAEFEHSRRYKGQSYQAISDRDQMTINQLFGAASDARRGLDETFVAIDMVLANPSPSARSDQDSDDDDTDEEFTTEEGGKESPTRVEPSTLREYLDKRFPGDGPPSENGMRFACELIDACELRSIETLSNTLDSIDSDQVRRLMDTATSVTRVRRLDDELLAKFGQSYIDSTGPLGNVEKRKQQLEWRYDRLREKVSKVRYKVYELTGSDCPQNLRNTLMPAARTVREVARLVAERSGASTVHIPDAVSVLADDLPTSARAKEIPLVGGRSLFVATNLGRSYSEDLIHRLLQSAEGLDLAVTKDGHQIASAP